MNKKYKLKRQKIEKRQKLRKKIKEKCRYITTKKRNKKSR